MTAAKKLRIALIIGDKGEVIGTHEVPDWSTYWDRAKNHYKNYEDDEREVLEIPHNLAAFRKDSNKNTGVNDCVFSATSDYLAHMLGIKLDKLDKEYFCHHPLVGAAGVSSSDTLRVIQEVVSPYGLAIYRVRVVPGLLPQGDMKQWTEILGINPMAIGNYAISNRHFSEATGVPLGEVDTEYRMDFSPEALRPAIVCGIKSGTGNSKGQAYEYSFAHAEYCSPRSPAEDGDMLQVQVLPKNMVVWKKLPGFSKLSDIPEVVTYELDLMDCKTPEGVKLWDKYQTATHGGNNGGARILGRFRGGASSVGSRTCVACKKLKKPKNLLPESGYLVCNPCWVEAWHKSECKNCHFQFGKGAPSWVGVFIKDGDSRLVGRCPKKNCGKLIWITQDVHKFVTIIAAEFSKTKGKSDATPGSTYSRYDEPPNDYHAFD